MISISSFFFRIYLLVAIESWSEYVHRMTENVLWRKETKDEDENHSHIILKKQSELLRGARTESEWNCEPIIIIIICVPW